MLLYGSVMLQRTVPPLVDDGGVSTLALTETFGSIGISAPSQSFNSATATAIAGGLLLSRSYSHRSAAPASAPASQARWHSACTAAKCSVSTPSPANARRTGIMPTIAIPHMDPIWLLVVLLMMKRSSACVCNYSRA